MPVRFGGSHDRDIAQTSRKLSAWQKYRKNRNAVEVPENTSMRADNVSFFSENPQDRQSKLIDNNTVPLLTDLLIKQDGMRLPTELLGRIASFSSPGIFRLNIALDQYFRFYMNRFKIRSSHDLTTVIRKFPNTKHLDISECHNLSDADCKQLAKLTNLEHLSIIGPNRVTDAGLQHLKALTKLQILNIGYCSGVTNTGLEHLLKELTNLQRLGLRGCSGVTNKGLKYVAELPNLLHLDISGYRGEIDELLEHLCKKLTKLKILDIRECPGVTNTGLKHLKALTNLQRLGITGCFRVTDSGLKHLKALADLRCLHMNWCFLVTDVGLKHLKALTHLEQFHISGCGGLTDTGLTYLKALTNLEEFHISYCERVTDAGIFEFRRELPQCDVEYIPGPPNDAPPPPPPNPNDPPLPYYLTPL